jgi:outer membrane receptor for ferrienterochelin and colicins
MFDANHDGFSELTPLENLTFGARMFHRFSSRDRLTFDFFAINEERNGGNMQDYPLHERDIAESLTHRMKVAGLTYERYFRDYDMLSIYVSGQFLNRDSYYGAAQSLSDYGNTRDRSYNAGLQYKAVFGNSSLVWGVENTSGFLLDKKLGYPDLDNATIVDNVITYIPHADNTIIANQSSVTTGTFAQYEVKMNRLKAALGARFDHYKISDLAHEDEDPKAGNVVSPRLSLMYELAEPLQARISYSQGYRAPQIFDEDLHIETSGSRQVIHRNDPDLRQETSHSLMASLDFNTQFGNAYAGLLVEGFYTRLLDAFVNEFGEPDEDGTVIYTRMNADGGATVAGINMEFKLRPARNFFLTSGLTLQTSEFEEPQDFDESRFFRTPNTYGFFALDWDFTQKFCLSGTGNYTGKMLVPYFGTENPDGELRTSDNFFDLGLKLRYTVKLNGASVEFAAGVKNMLNAYQDDFDIGIDRDPAYVYGPFTPRTIFVGIRFGNLLSAESGVSIGSKPGRGLRRGQPQDRNRMYRNRRQR